MCIVVKGEMTEDSIEEGFFGCGGVVHIPRLEDKLKNLARNGFKHHTTIGTGRMKKNSG